MSAFPPCICPSPVKNIRVTSQLCDCTCSLPQEFPDWAEEKAQAVKCWNEDEFGTSTVM